ncbi:MAG: hypothetical protein LIV11_02490 [Bacillota bacterium]|nr:hypothetical protein [Bacillota bacterium]
MERIIVTKWQAEKEGIYLEKVPYCRKVRNLAMLNRLILSESLFEANEYSKHLLSYIHSCGLEPREYLLRYLSSLQPYMIEDIEGFGNNASWDHFNLQDHSESLVCLLDYPYRIYVAVKQNETGENMVLVSYFEASSDENRGCKTKTNFPPKKLHSMAKETVPVFAEPAGSRIEGSDREQVKVFIPRGMLVYPVLVMARACEGGIFLADRYDLERSMMEACDQYLRDLYTSDLPLDALDQVEVFSVLQQLPYAAEGNTIFSNLTLLIDNLDIQKGFPNKAAADFALTTYIDHLYLDRDQSRELISVLREKYRESESAHTQAILNRIIDIIRAVADPDGQIVDMEE